MHIVKMTCSRKTLIAEIDHAMIKIFQLRKHDPNYKRYTNAHRQLKAFNRRLRAVDNNTVVLLFRE